MMTVRFAGAAHLARLRNHAALPDRVAQLNVRGMFARIAVNVGRFRTLDRQRPLLCLLILSAHLQSIQTQRAVSVIRTIVLDVGDTIGTNSMFRALLALAQVPVSHLRMFVEFRARLLNRTIRTSLCIH